ncbi:hypothetical protein ZHS_38 [Edwardsiella phage vB_EpM_ZHS]|jgi:hypothetical protein|nr:hypothetical protein ZHS_38 [Edwardsiella phage vB_EpM_ZHS]
MTKAALFKPMIHFERGWWRVTRAEVPWKYLRQADRERITKAHEHIFKLNNTDEAEAMRDAYYKSLSAKKLAEKKARA